MKKIIYIFSLFAAFLVLMPSTNAEEKQTKELRYIIVENQDGTKEIHITGLVNQIEHVVIPASIEGVGVTELADRAFYIDRTEVQEVGFGEPGYDAYNRSFIKSVSLPTTIKRIGEKALYGHQIQQLSLPEGLLEIGEDAISGNFMKELIIPKTVQILGEQSMPNYNSQTFEVPAQFKNEEGQPFGDLFYKQIEHNGQKEIRITGYNVQTQKTELTIPATINGLPVTEIGRFAFTTNKIWFVSDAYYKFPPVKIVNLPDTIRKIDDYAFYKMGLTNANADLKLPEGLQEIGTKAFAHNRLVGVSMPSTVTQLGVAAFEQNNLTKVVIGDGITSIPAQAFANNQISTLLLPNKLESIGQQAFESNKLKKILLPSSVKNVGDAAFRTNIINEVRLSNLKTINKYVFSANQLTTIEIPNSVTEIKEGAFQYNVLQSIKWPTDLKRIDAYAFQSNKLTTLQFPDNITSIGDVAFSSNELHSVQLPKNLNFIGVSAFFQNELQNLSIPENVTRISNNAFASNELKSVDLPDSLLNIGENAFDFNQLTSITLPKSLKVMEEGVFSNNQLTIIEWPDALQEIRKRAFSSNQLTAIDLPDTVTIISDYAFSSNQLTHVSIPASVKQFNMRAFGYNPLHSLALLGDATTIFPDAYLLATFDELHMKLDKMHTDSAKTKRWSNFGKVNNDPTTLYFTWKDESLPDTVDASTFSDISNHWAKEAIEEYVAKGIINGYPDGTFRPNAPIQRQHVAKILAQVFDIKPILEETAFKDVPKTHPYYVAISELQRGDILHGSNGNYMPTANLTRAQLAKILVRAAGFTYVGETIFPDVPATHWAKGYISSLADLGVVKGSNGQFMPNNAITRGQFVSMLNLALKEIEKSEQ